MAQVTALSPTATPGPPYTFVAKDPDVPILHDGTTTASDANTGTLVISSHVVQGTAPVLIVKVQMEASTATVTTVKWDVAGVNESLTQLNTARGNNASSDLWYLANPTPKTADVEIKISTAAEPIIGAASTYTGVDQTNPFRTAAKASATGTDDTPTVDVVALNGEMVVDSMAQTVVTLGTATGDHTERHDVTLVASFDDLHGASQEKESAGATETMGWSMTDADNWGIVAGPLQRGGPLPPVFIPIAMHHYKQLMGAN